MIDQRFVDLFKRNLQIKHGSSLRLLTRFEGSNALATFECVKGHITEARPRTVLQSHGNGCSACGEEQRIRSSSIGRFKIAKSKFLKRVEGIHKDKIEIVDSYKGSKTPIKVRCTVCKHEWNTAPERLFDGDGCPPCGRKRTSEANRVTTEQYFTKLLAKYAGAYLAAELYRDSYAAISHYCAQHDLIFSASPQRMLYGSAPCPACVRERLTQRGLNHRITTTEVDRRIKAKHGREVTRTGEYLGALIPTEFKCRKGHSWITTPDSVMRISGCPKCNSPIGHSKVAVEWIQQFSKHSQIEFEHAHNGGERHLYGASGKRYYVDGFSESNRLILEFNGDAWHGNPACFSRKDKPHPWSDATAPELHSATRLKALDLAAAGYTVVSVWESDWRCGNILSTTDPAWWS